MDLGAIIFQLVPKIKFVEDVVLIFILWPKCSIYNLPEVTFLSRYIGTVLHEKFCKISSTFLSLLL